MSSSFPIQALEETNCPFSHDSCKSNLKRSSDYQGRQYTALESKKFQKFSKLLPHTDQQTIQTITSSCTSDREFKNFKEIFKFYGKEEALALPLIQLIHKGIIYSEFKQLNGLNIPKNELSRLTPEMIKKILSFQISFNGKDFEYYLDALNKSHSIEEFKLRLISRELAQHEKGKFVEWDTLPQLELLIKGNTRVFNVMMNPPPEDPQAATVWDHYVVRKKEWNKLYANSDQQEYGKLMHRGIQLAAFGLMKKQWRAQDVVNFLAFHRCWIALNMRLRDYDKFGAVKRTPCVTSCQGIYHSVLVRLEELAKSLPKDTENVKVEKLAVGEPLKLQNFTRIGKEIIPLSSLIFSYGMLQHTAPDEAEKVMQHVYSLYEKAVKEKNPQKLTEQLGRIFWLVCQAKPWNLGDPSIAEMMVRTIWTIKGQENPPWKRDLIPWVEAASQPDVDAFAKSFASFFEWERSKNPSGELQSKNTFSTTTS